MLVSSASASTVLGVEHELAADSQGLGHVVLVGAFQF